MQRACVVKFDSCQNLIKTIFGKKPERWHRPHGLFAIRIWRLKSTKFGHWNYLKVETTVECCEKPERWKDHMVLPLFKNLTIRDHMVQNVWSPCSY